MKRSSSASPASGKDASKSSQKKSEPQQKTPWPNEQQASTVILDATPLRPVMLHWLAIIAIIMSGLAIAASFYPVLRPVVGPVLGLTTPAPEWQSDIAALTREDKEYRAFADAERKQLLKMITAIEQKTQVALSEGQSTREILTSLRIDITELRQRVNALDEQKNTALTSFETTPKVAEQAAPDGLAGNSDEAPGNSSGAEKNRSSLWDEWTSGWSLSGAVDYIVEVFNLSRVDEAPTL